MRRKKRFHSSASISLAAVQTQQKKFFALQEELRRVVLGQDDAIEAIVLSILANGHVLVEGIPGIAKTLLIRTLGKASGSKHSRIQFTVDLLPTDITGITSYEPKKGFFTIKGPIFSNFIIADEINRAPPKTQSALLEAMQEKQATIGRKTYPLQPPFFVMATQNPIEQAGVYKLPEAQIDRFFLKIIMGYPDSESEQKILQNNMTLQHFEDLAIKKVMSPSTILNAQKLVKKLFLHEDIEKYIIRIMDATRNPDKYKLKTGVYIQYGCSPRGSIALFIAAKAQAFLEGKNYVTPQNVKKVAKITLRHRIILNYEGLAENITTDEIIDEILDKVPSP